MKESSLEGTKEMQVKRVFGWWVSGHLVSGHLEFGYWEFDPSESGRSEFDQLECCREE